MIPDASLKTNRIERVIPCEEELSVLPLSFYKCQFCNLRVKTKSNLRAHLIKTHKLIEDEKDMAFLTKKKINISYVYHCPIVTCKYNIDKTQGFSKLSRLKQHYQIVHMKKAYQCNSCKQLFSTPTAQAYHTKSCGTIFECTVCHRKYSQKKFMHQHARRSGHKIYGDGLSLVLNNELKSVINNSKHAGLIESGPTTSQQPSTSSPVTKTVIMPVLILPYGKLADQASMYSVTENIRNLFANPQLLSSLVNAENHPTAVYNVPDSNPSMSIHDNLDYMQSLPSSIGQNNAYSTQMTTSFPQNAPDVCNNLVDVSTATMRRSDSFTQTDRFSAAAVAQCYQERNPQHHNASNHDQMQPHQQQNVMICNQNNVKTETGDNDCGGISEMLFTMTDSCIATSPTLCSAGNSPQKFLSNMSNAGTYMSPATSIGLQYMPSNSHDTMKTHSQFIQQPSMSDSFMMQQPSEMQRLPEFRSMISVASHTGFTPQHHNQMMTSVASSACLTASPEQFDNSPPVSYSNWSASMIRPTQSHTCLSVQPADFINMQPQIQQHHHQSMNGFAHVPVSSYNYEPTENSFGYDNSSSWAQVNLGPPMPSSSHNLPPGCTKSVQMNTCTLSANSVAVETTVDLTNFDPRNAGNCYWPLADNFTHMQTQTTIGEPENDFEALWGPNSVETQTAFQHQQFLHQQQQTGWPSMDCGVCVGVNTDRLTPENGSQLS